MQGTEESFDLWIDEDGEVGGGSEREEVARSTVTSFNFGEPVDVHVPDAEEILPEQP